MSHFPVIIEEEKDRLIEVIEHFKNEIEKLPKGTLVEHKKKKHKYVYLHFRKDKENISAQYIGKPGSDEVKEIEIKINRRRKLESDLRKAKKDLKEVLRLEKVVENQ